MEIPRGLMWAGRTVFKGGRLASLRVQEGLYTQQDRRNPQGRLSRMGIPTAAFQYGSNEYNDRINAHNANPANAANQLPLLTVPQEAIVNRYTPGTPAYEAQADADKEIVNARNRTRDKLERSRRSMIDALPFGSLIQKRVGLYYRPFDPYRRDDYRGVSSLPEVVREGRRWVERSIENTANQYNQIQNNGAGLNQDAPLYWIQQWYIGKPRPALVGITVPTAAAPHNADAVYQAAFNTQANMAKLVWQWRTNMRKIDDLVKLAIKYLNRHKRHMLRTMDTDRSPALDTFNSLMGKWQVTISGSTNEPALGRSSMLTPFWG